MENQPLISSRMKSLIDRLTNLNVFIQSYYQRIQNKIQNATELHQLETIEVNYQLNTHFYRKRFIKIKVLNLNIRYKGYDDKLKALNREFGRCIYTTIRKIDNKRRELLHKGLIPERIQKFHHYVADKSTVGGQCTICIQEFEVGKKMMRLDCNHEFCEECIEGWFAEHKTCPNCRKSF